MYMYMYVYKHIYIYIYLHVYVYINIWRVKGFIFTAFSGGNGGGGVWEGIVLRTSSAERAAGQEDIHVFIHMNVSSSMFRDEKYTFFFLFFPVTRAEKGQVKEKTPKQGISVLACHVSLPSDSGQY